MSQSRFFTERNMKFVVSAGDTKTLKFDFSEEPNINFVDDEETYKTANLVVWNADLKELFYRR